MQNFQKKTNNSVKIPIAYVFDFDSYKGRTVVFRVSLVKSYGIPKLRKMRDIDLGCKRCDHLTPRSILSFSNFSEPFHFFKM